MSVDRWFAKSVCVCVRGGGVHSGKNTTVPKTSGFGGGWGWGKTTISFIAWGQSNETTNSCAPPPGYRTNVS